MEAEIIGYKLKYPEYSEAINKILGFCFNNVGFEKNYKNYSLTFSFLNDAKVLDIWFEPVYNIVEKIEETLIKKMEGMYKKINNSNSIFEIVGYKLKDEFISLEDVAAKIGGKGLLNEFTVCDNYDFENKTLYIKNFKATIYNLRSAGVLDIWFTPIYKTTTIYKNFGEIKVKIKKGFHFVDTEFGNISIDEIKKAIEYIENPPSLSGYKLNIHNHLGYEYLNKINKENPIGIQIGFGCKSGGFDELKDIYNAYCELNNS